MALSEEEKHRIREEEWIRITAREDFRQARPPGRKDHGQLLAVAILFIVLLTALARYA